MDLLTGSPLSKVCKNNPPTKEQMINWGIDVATAIKGLHSLSPSMLYMDCKPDNLILCEDGSVRPVDIGSIYICDSSDKRRISGTAAFAAPEQKSCGQPPVLRKNTGTPRANLIFLRSIPPLDDLLQT